MHWMSWCTDARVPLLDAWPLGTISKSIVYVGCYVCRCRLPGRLHDEGCAYSRTVTWYLYTGILVQTFWWYIITSIFFTSYLRLFWFSFLQTAVWCQHTAESTLRPMEESAHTHWTGFIDDAVGQKKRCSLIHSVKTIHILYTVLVLLCVFFFEVLFHVINRVTGACPLTTDLIMRVDAKTTKILNKFDKYLVQV